MLDLVDQVQAGRGREPFIVDNGDDEPEYDDDDNIVGYTYYPDEEDTDAYTELKEGIARLFRRLEEEHQTNLRLAREAGGNEGRLLRERIDRLETEVRQLKAAPGSREDRDLATTREERAAAPNRLWHDGSGWQVTYNGETRKLGDLDGLLYMSYALERPGPAGIQLLDIEMQVRGQTDVYSREDALDAEAEIAAGWFDDEDGADEHDPGMRYADYSKVTSTGDTDTLEGYREARRQLARRIYHAEQTGDEARIDQFRSEQRLLDAEIRKLEQSTKRGPENEGASKAHITKVRNAINYAKDRAIPKKFPSFGAHLRQSFTCESNSAVYNPSAPTRWTIEGPG